MDKRIKFLNEESSFFNAPNYLISEGFISKDKFCGMFGLVGLAECVNHLLKIKDPKKGFGNNKEAELLGLKIMDKIQALVNKHKAPYSKAVGGKYRLHAQVGINTDGGEDSPGTRIPVGCEPVMPIQLNFNEKFQPYFPTGTGDIFKFEETWINSPEAVLDIIKGAFKNNLRYFSGYLENNDVVRVTGYLVKKSELKKLDEGKASLNQVTLFGQGSRDGQKSLDRRIERYDERLSK
jgi:YjjI family glycine radical enzyme